MIISPASLVVFIRECDHTQILYTSCLRVNDDQIVAWAQRIHRRGGRLLLPLRDRWAIFGTDARYREFRTRLASAGITTRRLWGYRLTPTGKALVERLIRFSKDGKTEPAPAWWGQPQFDDGCIPGTERFLYTTVENEQIRWA